MSTHLQLQRTPLFECLLDLPETELRDLALEHGICSLLSRHKEIFRETSTQDLFLKSYQQNLIKNIVFLDEYEKLNSSLLRKEQSQFTPLKGISLLKTLYSLGERSLTDMDLYTKLPPSRFIPFLEMEGYQFQKEKKWLFNNHKWVFFKKNDLLEITLEIHTQLLVQDRSWTWEIQSDGRLSHEDEFLYLTAHWAQQHTCLKLFWLFDLYFYMMKYQIQTSANLWKKAERLKIKNSLVAALLALDQNFQAPRPPLPFTPTRLLEQLMSPENLLYLPKNRFRYLLLKHLVKDSALDNLTYDFLWLKNKIETKKWIHSKALEK